jgi:hypothetical protein
MARKKKKNQSVQQLKNCIDFVNGQRLKDKARVDKLLKKYPIDEEIELGLVYALDEYQHSNDVVVEFNRVGLSQNDAELLLQKGLTDEECDIFVDGKKRELMMKLKECLDYVNQCKVPSDLSEKSSKLNGLSKAIYYLSRYKSYNSKSRISPSKGYIEVEASVRNKKTGKVLRYPMIKTAVNIDGDSVTFARTYGKKRTKEQAIRLVLTWREKMLESKQRDRIESSEREINNFKKALF